MTEKTQIPTLRIADLKPIRVRKGLTLEQVADVTGLSIQKIHGIESAGVGNLRLAEIARVCAVYGVPLEKLVEVG